MKRQRFQQPGALALAPMAWGMFFDLPDAPETMRSGDISVVSVRGPLMHHADWWFDSYDAIKTRVAEQLETKPKALVLSIDSPGGLVSGCFDTATELRAMCDAAGVRLVAYVDGQATSAAYALACVCERIYAPQAACVGSIGVFNALVDITEQDKMWGVRFTAITSGARKADGNPHVPTSDAAIAAAQAEVNDLAQMFFEHVAARRPMTVEQVSALEAGTMTGASALGTGLVDELATLDEVLVALARDDSAPTGAEETEMSAQAGKDYEEALAKLKKAAEGDDDDAKKAKRMLDALAEDGDADEDEDEASAEGDDKDEDKDDEASASIEKRVAQLEAAQRDAMIAARPDIEPKLAAELRRLPLATAQRIVDATPKRTVGNRAATAVVPATLGASTPQTGTPQAAGVTAMDVAMGTPKARMTATGVRRDERVIELGTLVPQEKANG